MIFKRSLDPLATDLSLKNKGGQRRISTEP